MASLTLLPPETSSGEPLYKDFGPPFDAADADIIIRSSDGYDFRIHRVLLALASVAFRNMFAVQPQPVSLDKSTQSADDFKDGLPVVCLTESSTTLFTLFTLIYPGDPPKISGRAHTLAVVRAMDKYMLEDYPNTITAALLNLSESSPHAVLALAFRHNSIAPEVRVAAAYSLLKLPTIVSSAIVSDEELDLFTASQYRKILVFHRDCGQEALAVIARYDWAKKSWAQFSCGKAKKGINKWENELENCTCNRTSRKIDMAPRPDSEHSLKRHIFVAEWATHFVSRCEAALKETPHWSIIEGISIRSSASKADSCDLCTTRAVEELESLSNYLVRHVRRAIEQVK